MSLPSSKRGFRATTAVLVGAALAIAPAAAQASSPPRAAAHTVATAKQKVAAQTKAKRKKAETGRSANGLGNTVGLSAATQLAAMNTAIKAAPSFYAGRDSGCKLVTPLLVLQSGSTMAGNFRDADGYCYVWLNLKHSDLLTGSEICKVALHEVGHLDGLEHSADPADIMYSPFNSTPIPGVCAKPGV